MNRLDTDQEARASEHRARFINRSILIDEEMKRIMAWFKKNPSKENQNGKR